MKKLILFVLIFSTRFAYSCDRLLAIEIAQKTVKDLARTMGASTFTIGQDSLSEDGRDYHFIFSFNINNTDPSSGVVAVGTESCYSSTKKWGAAKEFYSN